MKFTFAIHRRIAITIFCLLMTLRSFSQESNRPQEPQEPFPYIVKEVTFASKASDTITLAGSLTLPDSTGQFPVAILISGSGPQDRNEEIFKHKPFMVIADHLTKAGIAVLRFDDRGVGASTGTFANATSFDFALDVEGAIAYLRNNKSIDSDNMGLIGHSEGGLIAQIITAKDTTIKYLVSMAGPGIKGSDLMVLQNVAMVEKMGISDSLIQQLKKTLEVSYRHIDDTNLTDDQLKDSLTTALKQGPKSLIMDMQIPMIIQQITAPWYKTFLRYDPAPYLNKIQCDVLALNGDKDLQVVCEDNLDGYKKELTQLSDDQLKVIKYEGMNHLFQECETGMVMEYSSIKQTIAPQVLDDMRDWILEKVKE